MSVCVLFFWLFRWGMRRPARQASACEEQAHKKSVQGTEEYVGVEEAK